MPLQFAEQALQSFGAIRFDLNPAAQELFAWQSQVQLAHGSHADIEPVHGPLQEVISKLQPVGLAVRDRMMLLRLEGDWLLYLDNSPGGTDASSTMRWLSRKLCVPSLRVCNRPKPAIGEQSFSHEARIVEWYGTDGRSIRSIFSVFDGTKWQNGEVGDPLGHETPSVKRNRGRNYFPSEELIGFLAGLGFHSIDLASPERREGKLISVRPAATPQLSG